VDANPDIVHPADRSQPKATPHKLKEKGIGVQNTNLLDEVSLPAQPKGGAESSLITRSSALAGRRDPAWLPAPSGFL
jgi:hypothetical protein